MAVRGQDKEQIHDIRPLKVIVDFS